MRPCKYAGYAFVVAAARLVIGCENAPHAHHDHSHADKTGDSAVQTPAAPPKAAAKKDTLLCRYKAGDSEKIRVFRERFFRTWVEMPGDEPSVPGSRRSNLEITLQRDVEKVNADGSALIKVTVLDVKRHLDIDTTSKKSKFKYISNSEQNESTWDGQPAINGATYQIVVAPDTSVKEIIGIDALKSEYKLTKKTSLVSSLFEDDLIAKIHERAIVRDRANGEVTEKGVQSLMPNEEATIKARAIRNTYSCAPGQGNIVSVSFTGEAAFTAPEGFPEPAKPSDMMQVTIVTNSDMNELVINGEGTFDKAAGKVLSENRAVKCTLILDGNKLFAKPDQEPKQGDKGGGEMFTVTELKETFEVLSN